MPSSVILSAAKDLTVSCPRWYIPYLAITIFYLGGISKIDSRHADLPRTETVVGHAIEELLVGIQVQITSFGDDCQLVGLSKTGSDGRAKSIDQRNILVATFIEVESICPIDTDAKEIERALRAIGAEDHAALPAAINNHRHLVDEITKVGGLGKAGLEIA